MPSWPNRLSHLISGAFSQVTLFHSHVCEAIPEDYLLELADWAYRKLTYLNSKEAAKFAEPKGDQARGEA